MRDDPRPNRQSTRWRGYDYTSAGAYFATICTFGRRCCLSRIEDGVVRLLPAGRIVQARWQALPRHFPHVDLDAFVAMPNHVHLVLFLRGVDADAGDASAGFGEGDGSRPLADASPLPVTSRPKGAPAGSLGAIIGNLKSTSTLQVNRLERTPGRQLWQRGYYDRVVRDDRELDLIRAYTAENPLNWAVDLENPDVPRPQSPGTT